MDNAERRFEHLRITDLPEPKPFKSKGGGGGDKDVPPVRDRKAHADKLLDQLSLIARAAKADAARTDLPEDARGVYVAVEARPGVPLAMDSLGKSDSVMLGGYGRDQAQMAAILLSEGAVGKLDRKLLEYRDENGIYNGEDTGKPKHQSLIESIGSIRLAVLRDLWADDSTDFPDQGVEYRWETWLLPETWTRFKSVAEALGLRTGLRPLIFPDIDVVLVFATSDQMAELMDRTRAIARVGRSSTTADFFDSLPTPNQGEFVEDAASRLTATSPEDVRSVLCLLDTGVERGHPLIAPFLAVDDRHAVDPGWGEGDHVGHGTEMAGVALFGDLVPHLAGTHAIAPLHRLESVKVVPPVGKNDYDQLALITRMAVETVETRRGDVQRVYSLATTTEEDTPHDGFPTIWSAELDQLSVGKDVPGGNPRLICVSAGNVGSSSGGVPSERPSVSRYPRLNDESELESPGQSWNALTIGAFTEKQVLTDTKLDGYEPIAPVGDICPVSRTASWDKTWPIKPELLMEGGNWAADPGGDGWEVSDLGILTTSKNFPNPYLTTTRATSPATADAARYAAILADEYPDLWPETIRALLVNSASWTPAMERRMNGSPSKTKRARLMKRYGYGVPDLERARRSASNCLTLIIQDSIQPYVFDRKKDPITGKRKSYATLNEMKLYELPWPIAALEALSGEVSMRVTLSYFVEPNPSEAARGRKLRYASHGLRFKVPHPDEDMNKFQVRINQEAAVEMGDVEPGESESRYWRYGRNARDVGSVHSDIWVGPASDLARSGVVAVHPVGGWWKDRLPLERYDSIARFALVVTIDAAEMDVDIRTPVLSKIAIVT